jgi:response regulator of citrate/malate metabolism
MQVVQAERPIRLEQSHGRVLIVEDDVLIAVMLEQMVDELGYEVVGTASTLDDARELIESKSPDIVVLDRYVREQLTIEFADELIQRKIAFVLMVASEVEQIPARHMGMPYVTKPFADHDLEKAMRVSRAFASGLAGSH